MDILEQLLTLSNVMICLAIVALVWVQRKIIELTMARFGKDVTKSRAWRELWIPIGPLGTGAALMLIPGMPVPEMFATSATVKVIFGIGLGLMSGLIFRLIKKMVFDKAGKEDEKTVFTEE